jgi:hypothetical protein
MLVELAFQQQIQSAVRLKCRLAARKIQANNMGGRSDLLPWRLLAMTPFLFLQRSRSTHAAPTKFSMAAPVKPSGPRYFTPEVLVGLLVYRF